MASIEDLDTIVLVIVAAITLGVILALVRSARRTPPRSGCIHELQSSPRWTQDGWVTVCLMCREWIYRGDDYDNPPA